MGGTLFTRQSLFAPVAVMVRPPSLGNTDGAKETAPWEVSNLHERAKSLALKRSTVQPMCGIIGILSHPDSQVAQSLYDGLLVLQRRGKMRRALLQAIMKISHTEGPMA